MREPDFVDECYADKDLSLLKKLTLVIPTYNRNYYLSRCLWYHAHFPFGEIIVADSSPEEKKVVNRETVLKVREMFGANVRYLEYEPETEKYGGDIYRKWGDAVQHVETEYSIVCGDKIFEIPTTLNKLIEYLDINREYDVIDGLSLLLKKKDRINNIFVRELPFRKPLSLSYSDTLARIIVYCSSRDETINLLAMRRTSVHKMIYHLINSTNINDLRFGEIGLELLSVIKSKSAYIYSDVYSCRDTTNIGTSSFTNSFNESSSTRYPTIDVYKKDGVYDTYSQALVNLVKNELSSSTTLSYDESDRLASHLIDYLTNLRGFDGNSPTRKLVIKFSKSPLRYLWTILPICLQSKLLVKFGLYYGSTNDNYFFEYTTNELILIDNIVRGTEILRDKDKTII